MISSFKTSLRCQTALQTYLKRCDAAARTWRSQQEYAGAPVSAANYERALKGARDLCLATIRSAYEDDFAAAQKAEEEAEQEWQFQQDEAEAEFVNDEDDDETVRDRPASHYAEFYDEDGNWPEGA